jgi:hypothetical protein
MVAGRNEITGEAVQRKLRELKRELAGKAYPRALNLLGLRLAYGSEEPGDGRSRPCWAAMATA